MVGPLSQRARLSSRRIAATVFGGVMSVALVTGVAIAAIPDAGSGLIHGCYSTTSGAARVVDPARGQRCHSGEAAVNWNQRGVNWRGGWGTTATYAVNDAVAAHGGSYVAVRPSHGVDPNNATYWALLARPGASGARGAQGAQGPQGLKGDAGAQGPSGGSNWAVVSSAGDFTVTNTGGAATGVIGRIATGEYCLAPGDKPVWITPQATPGADPVVASTAGASSACPAKFGHIFLRDSKTGVAIDDGFTVLQAP